MIRWLWIPLIFVVNYLLTFAPDWQLDLTANKLHSLSPASIRTVRELKKPVEIKVYMSQGLPAQIQGMATDLRGILTELQNNSKGKIKLTFVDPLKDKTAADEAQKLGIQQLQFSSIKSDKFEIQSGYFGLAVKNDSKSEVLPVANDIGNLEYTIISGIKKLASNQIETVALTADQPAQSQIQYFSQFLSRSYNIVPADLSGDKPIGDNAKTLIIVGADQKIDDKGIAKINKWLNDGKGLAAFVDRIGVDSGLTAQKLPETGLEKIFEKYGIKLNDGLVLDQSSAIASFRSQSGSFMVQYPYWIQVQPNNINSAIPALSGLNSLTLPWASPLTVEGKAKVMFKSSSLSEVDDSANDLSPTTKKSLNAKNSKSYPLAALNNDGVKLAVVGDSDFIKDQFVSNSQQNLAFALNLVDYLSGDDSLLTIRNKTVSVYPIISLNDQQKLITKSINLGLPLLILGMAGVIISLKRKPKLTPTGQ